MLFIYNKRILNDNNLSGSIPSSIKNLILLQEMYIYIILKIF